MDNTGGTALSASTATDNQLQLVTCPHPLTMERQRMALPVGGTLREMLADGGIYTPYAYVFVNDELIPFEQWELVRPEAGSIVTARVVPSGGGGGKNPLRTVLQIAVLVVAAYVAGPAGVAVLGKVGAGIAAAGVGIVGSLAINALIPPPMPNMSGGGGLSLDRGHAITGSRNRAVPFGTVPCVLGTNRLYPLMAAMPYTETLGDKQFYRMLFCAGYAPLTTSAFKIGETDLAEFDGVEIVEGVSDVNPPELFSSDVYEESVGVKLPTYDYSGGSPDHSSVAWTQRTTQANVDEISLDLGTFSGLFYMSEKGKRKQVDIDIHVQSSPAGTGVWTDVVPAEITGPGTDQGGGVIRLTAKEAKVFWIGLRWGVVGGQYDVRMRRVAITVAGSSPWNDKDQDSLFDDVHWASLRSITQVQPVAMPGVHLIALRIQATDQLEGIVDRFNLVAQAHVPIYDGISWSTAASNSPAWAYAAVLTGPANKRPLPLARLDAAALKTWADDCTSAGFTFNAVIDGRTTVLEMLNNITAVGRAARAMNDGLHSMVQDVAQAVPVQLFSPRNSWGFSGTKVFAEQAHALKVKFVRAANGYQQDEITVYDDGYDAGNATRFETIELYGVDNADQAWKLARYHIAVARLRPESYELSVDVEHIVCTRGDLVRVAHDVPKWGSSWGRIKSIAGLDITLDEQVLVEAGESYVVRIRTADGTILTEGVSAAAGETNTLTLDGALAGIADGDLVLFGLLGSESVELIVKAIEPGPDLTARLRLVDAAPGVLLADQGTIPVYSSNMTGLEDPSIWIPPVPNIVSISSTLRAPQPGIEGLTAALKVCYTAPAGGKIAPSWVEAQVRLSGSDSWSTVPAVPAAIGEIEVDGVIPDEVYDVRVRALSHYRTPSDWSAISIYTPDGSAQDAYLESVANLRVLESAGTSFEGCDCNLVWDGFSAMFAPPVWFKHFKIEIRDLDDTLRRTETVQEPHYTYTYGMNYDDGAGMVEPSFKVLLQVVDVEDIATVPIEITAINSLPTGASALQTVGELFAIRLQCSYLRPADFDFLEIWAATSNDRAGASLVGACLTDEFLHSGLTAAANFFYWVRVVDLYGQAGPWYPAAETGGVAGTVSAVVDGLLTQLAGAVTEDTLNQALQNRLDSFASVAGADFANGQQGWTASGATLADQTGSVRITSTGTTPLFIGTDLFLSGQAAPTVRVTIERINGAGWAGVMQYQTAADQTWDTAKQISFNEPDTSAGFAFVDIDTTSDATWSAGVITKLRFQFGNTSSDVFDLQRVEIGRTVGVTMGQPVIDALQGQYTVKIDQYGRVAGFGLANYPPDQDSGDPSFSEFQVLADRFQVVIPSVNGGDPKIPFVAGTVDGVAAVIMPAAFLGDASVSTLKIGVDAVTVPEYAEKTTDYSNSWTFTSSTAAWGAYDTIFTSTVNTLGQPLTIFMDGFDLSTSISDAPVGTSSPDQKVETSILVDGTEVWMQTLTYEAYFNDPMWEWRLASTVGGDPHFIHANHAMGDDVVVLLRTRVWGAKVTGVNQVTTVTLAASSATPFKFFHLTTKR